MAEEKPSLHIDTDWKKQAQEEKRKLAEQAQQAKAAPPAGSSGVAAGAAPAATAAQMVPGEATAAAARGPRGGRGRRGELPSASFPTLIQSLMTQTFYYLGELAQGGGEPAMNLDMAKLQIDTLGMLEEKTNNNLTPEEKQFLDSALYESRTRFVNVASQFV